MNKEFGFRLRHLFAAALVADPEPEPEARQKARRCPAGQAQAQNARHLSRPQRQWVRSAAHLHLSFRVLRAKRPRIMDMIQKRITTLGSGQPFFSKWWWKGAMRKMRLPWLSLK